LGDFKKREVAELWAQEDLELMAVLALGHSAQRKGDGERDLLDKKVFLRK
jgi:hypothetical protein